MTARAAARPPRARGARAAAHAACGGPQQIRGYCTDFDARGNLEWAGLAVWGRYDEPYLSVPCRSAAVRPSEARGAHRAEIRKIVADHHAANARIFGSVVTG